MKPLSRDTSAEVQRKHFELMRRLSPEQKFSLAFALTDAMRQFVLADLQHRFPDAGEEEIRRRFIARVLSRQEVICAYGFDPKLESPSINENLAGQGRSRVRRNCGRHDTRKA